MFLRKEILPRWGPMSRSSLEISGGRQSARWMVSPRTTPDTASISRGGKTFTSTEQYDAFPDSSTALKVRVVVPIGKTEPELSPVPSVCMTDTALHSSVACGRSKVTTRSQSTSYDSEQVITGAVLSSTIISI